MECAWLQPLMVYINLYLSPFVILQLPPCAKLLVSGAGLSQTASLIFLDRVIQLKNIKANTRRVFENTEHHEVLS